MHGIGNDVKISCVVQSFAHISRCPVYSGKRSSYQNSIATRMKGCHLAGGIYEFSAVCVIFWSRFLHDGAGNGINRNSLLSSSPQVTTCVVSVVTTVAFSCFSVIPKALLKVSYGESLSFVKSVLLCVGICFMMLLQWIHLKFVMLLPFWYCVLLTSLYFSR